MSKNLKEEELRLNIIVNGDPARKEIGQLDRSTKDLASSNKKLRAEMKQLKADGGENKIRIAEINAEIKKNNETIKANEIRIKQLRSEMKLTSMTTAELSQRHAELRNVMRNVVPGTPQWKQLQTEMRAVSVRMAQLRTETTATEGVMCRMASNVNKYIGTATAAFAAFAMYGSGLRKSVQAYSGLDEAMSNARKTTNMTRKEVEDLNAILAKIDTRTAQNDLLSLARIGGKLGIAKNDIEGFTRAADVIKIALGRDLGDNVETTIGQIGKLVNVFQLNKEFDIEQGMMKTAAAVNELGKSSVANEANIVEFMRRVGGVGNAAKMSIANVAGLGATLDAVGITMEVAGTSMSQVITGMFRRTDVFAAAAKMSVKDFKKLMAEDMNEAIIRFAEGMGSNGAAMGKIVAALDSLKLDGTRATGVLTALAQNTGMVREQQEIANRAFVEGTSCMKEFNIMNSSAEAITEKKKKQITAEATALGKSLVPAYHDSLSAQAALIKATHILVEWLIENKGAILGLSTSYGAYILLQKGNIALKTLQAFWSKKHRVALLHEVIAINTVTASTEKAKTATILMAAAQNLLVGNFRAAGLAAKAFFTSLGPIGWITIALGGVAAAWGFIADRTTIAGESQKLLSSHMKNAVTDAVAEQTELDRLKGKLEGCEIGTKEYNKTKQEIIDKFGKYDSTLKDETLTVQTLREKYDSLTDAIMQSAKTRQYNKLVEAQQASFDEQFSEVSDKLWENLNDSYYTEKASKYYNQIMSAFFGGQSLDAWLTTGSSGAKKLVNQLKELRDLQDATDKAARARFGINTPPSTISSTTTTKKPDPNNESDPNKTPHPDDANESKKTWSLDNNVNFLTEKKKLRQQYADGEIVTEQSYQDKLRTLEITALKARLAANKESGADREKLSLQLADKLVEQKRQEQQQVDAAEDLRIQNMTDATDRENAEYERRKKQYQGNTAALEQIETAHNRNLVKIELQRATAALKQEEDEYKQSRQVMQDHHRFQLQAGNRTKEGRTHLKRQQSNELKALDEEYFRSSLAQLQSLSDTGTMSFRDLKGILQTIDLDTSLLSEEEKNELIRRIKEVTGAIDAAAEHIDELGYSFTQNQGGGSLFGFSQDDWSLFFENIGNGKFGADEMTMALLAAAEAANMAMDLYSSYDKMMTAKENAELKKYKKTNDAKKKTMQNRLDAGLMSQEQYNAEVERMEADYEKKQEEAQIKQAKRQKTQSIIQATINTAVGVVKTLSEWGLPWGLIPAGIMAAMGAAQIAMIAATPIAGAEVGGFAVERTQDGKRYNARVSPDARGYVDRPTVLVGENGMEYVIPNEAMDNPTARPIINLFETVRKQGRLSDFNFEEVLPALYTAPGRAAGGSLRSSTSTDTAGVGSPFSYSDEDTKKIIDYLEYLCKKADEPIPAVVAMLGHGGFVEKYDEYIKLKRNGNLGR